MTIVAREAIRGNNALALDDILEVRASGAAIAGGAVRKKPIAARGHASVSYRILELTRRAGGDADAIADVGTSGTGPHTQPRGRVAIHAIIRALVHTAVVHIIGVVGARGRACTRARVTIKFARAIRLAESLVGEVIL